MKPGQVFVVGDGKISCLSSDNIDLRQIGRVELKRASHVDGSADLSDAAVMWLCGYGSTEQRRLFSVLASMADYQRDAFLMGVGLVAGKDAVPEKVQLLRGSLPTDIWWADLLPSNGPVLGPFNTRTEALDAEVAWLRENEFKVPKPDCTG